MSVKIDRFDNLSIVCGKFFGFLPTNRIISYFHLTNDLFLNTADENIRLWESFRKGDKEAFAALFREHYKPLYRFGNKFTNDTELLEDCIQELFVELWQAKSQAPVLSVKAYLLKSLKYKLLKAFRKNGMICRTRTGGRCRWPSIRWAGFMKRKAMRVPH